MPGQYEVRAVWAEDDGSMQSVALDVADAEAAGWGREPDCWGVYQSRPEGQAWISDQQSRAEADRAVEALPVWEEWTCAEAGCDHAADRQIGGHLFPPPGSLVAARCDLWARVVSSPSQHRIPRGTVLLVDEMLTEACQALCHWGSGEVTVWIDPDDLLPHP